MKKNLLFLLKCCTIFGIYIPQSGTHSPKLRISIALHMSFLIGIVCLNTIVGISTTPLSSDYIISWFVSVIIFISQMLTYLVILWEALFKQQEHTDFLRLLKEIEIALKLRLRATSDDLKNLEDLRKLLIIMIVISIMGLSVYAAVTIMIYDFGYFWWALIAILAMRVRSLQLIMYVELLKGYLMALNQKLNQVVCFRTAHERRLMDVDYKYLESLKYMENIRDLYSLIYTALYYFNEFAQTSMFLSTASIFLDSTCHIYWTLLALDNLLPVVNIVLAATTIIPLTMKIIKFCLVCQVLKEECHRTSLMVTRLMVEPSTFPCLEAKRNYHNLLYDFSLQLLHQRIEVTGKSFFNFDLKCIFSICVLILTHLIILIQFTKNDGSSDMETSSTVANDIVGQEYNQTNITMEIS